jgi:hypothetical protein
VGNGVWLIIMAICASVLAMIRGLLALGTRKHRAVPESVAAEIARLPERRRGQHVVDLELRDGRRVEGVWVAFGKYPALIGGRTRRDRYRPADVVHAYAHDSA